MYNSKLHIEYYLICNKLCKTLIGNKRHPRVIVDWTKVPNKKFHILRTALVAAGRDITIYLEDTDIILPKPDVWIKYRDLKDIVTKSPKYIGEINLTKKYVFKTNMYVVKSTNKGRHVFTQSGNIKQDSSSKSKSRVAKEPWCFVTSFDNKSYMSKKIVKIYQTRMQVEEGIRDLKSSKYGFGFEHMLSYKQIRILILLLIAQIA